ncbi:MAG: hypothetical protein K0B07_00140 [DPANN group archaeon]|nr:hypothetical protein [DPANN group archaeon]
MINKNNNRYNYLYALLPVAGLFFDPVGPAIGSSIAYFLLLLKKDMSLEKNILYLGILMSCINNLICINKHHKQYCCKNIKNKSNTYKTFLYLN